MKQGTTFEELVRRVEHDAGARHDFIVPANAMSIETDALGTHLSTGGHGIFDMRDVAHGHLAELAGIDLRYYRRLRVEAPALLDSNVNHWLARSPKNRLVRALDNDVRAIASERYAALDHDALLNCLAPIMDEWDGTVESSDIDDRRLIVKLVSPRLEGDVAVGDTVQAGLVIENSETRQAGLRATPFIKRLVCTNGMTIGQNIGTGARRRHSGPVWSDSLESESIDRRGWEAGVWKSFQESIRTTLSTESFKQILDALRASTGIKISPAEPDFIAERLRQTFGLSEQIERDIIFHLQADGSNTAWELLNAVTRTAEDLDDYSAASELETLGGRLALWSPRQWEQIINPN